MRLILRGGSVIDWRRLHFQTKEEVDRYLRLCLFEPDDPFDRDALQRLLDEAVEYLRTSFRYRVADEVAHPDRIQDLFLLASGAREPRARDPGAVEARARIADRAVPRRPLRSWRRTHRERVQR
jgi:uncharacterized protein (TIGR04552 family)